MRLTIVFLGLSTIAWTFSEHHVARLGETLLFAAFAGYFVPAAGLVWVFYLAVEPFVRRRWPHMLVSWTRLVSGDWRDPLVGRDVLIGVAVGVLVTCATLLQQAARPLLDRPLLPTVLPNLNWFNSATSFIGALFGMTTIGLVLPLINVLALLLLRVVLRRDWLAGIGLWVFTTISSAGFNVIDWTHWISVALGLSTSALVAVTLMRVGLLAAMGFSLTVTLMSSSPLTMHASAWYATIGYALLLILGLLALYAFRVAIGGRPLLGAAVIDE